MALPCIHMQHSKKRCKFFKTSCICMYQPSQCQNVSINFKDQRSQHAHLSWNRHVKKIPRQTSHDSIFKDGMFSRHMLKKKNNGLFLPHYFENILICSQKQNVNNVGILIITFWWWRNLLYAPYFPKYSTFSSIKDVYIHLSLVLF